jgi:hypothetical protein
MPLLARVLGLQPGDPPTSRWADADGVPSRQTGGAEACGRGRIHHLVAAALCLVVLLKGARTSGDLAWPPDPDHFRDIAQAQTIQDGGWLHDPFYRGESIWYNPLLSGILAGISALAGQPIHIVATRAGAYLNLLAPVTFYLLVFRLMGPPVALTSLVGFLFLVRGPTWAVPTYSPWLFSSVFTQPFFYLTLAEYYTAIGAERPWRYLLVGVLLGVTFLGHTGPAIVAVLTILAVTGYRVVAGERKVRTHARDLVLIAGPVVLIALPFLWSIVGHYRLSIENPTPLIWRDPQLPPERWETLWKIFSGRYVVNSMVLLGLGAMIAARVRRRAGAIVVAWLGTSLLLFIYNHFLILRPNWPAFPPLLPAHHFLVYERAAEMVAVGVGLTLSAMGLAWLAWQATRWVAPRASFERTRCVVYAAMIAAVVGYNYPAFLARPAFGQERETAEAAYATDELRAIVPWIRANSHPSDVFLTSDSACLSVVGPAGRKCVLAPRFFSNPYVSWDVRRDAHRAMWDALVADDCVTFQNHAYAYRVRYVMTVESRTPELPSGRCGLLPTSFPGTNWRIYRAFRF